MDAALRRDLLRSTVEQTRENIKRENKEKTLFM
jgi:hypothetical protein